MTNRLLHFSAAILLVLAIIALGLAQLSFFYSAAKSSNNHLYTPLWAQQIAANPANQKRLANQIRDAPTNRPICTDATEQPLMECTP